MNDLRPDSVIVELRLRSSGLLSLFSKQNQNLYHVLSFFFFKVTVIIILRMYGTFQKAFSQAATFQMYFPRSATSQMYFHRSTTSQMYFYRSATPQMCNIPSGNFPNKS